MADISASELKEEVAAILKKADLEKTTLKKVIQELTKKYGVEIRQRKPEINQMVTDCIKSMESDKEEEEEDDEKDKSSSDSEEVVEKPKRGAATRAKRAPAKPKKAGGVTKGKGTGFTRSYKLSPALAELMGAEEMPRHAVVKRIWAIVKEKQLYDPNNKQFAICDDAMYKVIGKQRFRVFGMMKYLKTHFLADD